MHDAPNWGITPVPARLRVLGLWDTFLLWANLSVSLLVIVAGAFLVPGLSLRDAFFAILVAALAGNAMLGLAGAIGAEDDDGDGLAALIVAGGTGYYVMQGLQPSDAPRVVEARGPEQLGPGRAVRGELGGLAHRNSLCRRRGPRPSTARTRYTVAEQRVRSMSALSRCGRQHNQY